MSPYVNLSLHHKHNAVKSILMKDRVTKNIQKRKEDEFCLKVDHLIHSCNVLIPYMQGLSPKMIRSVTKSYGSPLQSILTRRASIIIHVENTSDSDEMADSKIQTKDVFDSPKRVQQSKIKVIDAQTSQFLSASP